MQRRASQHQYSKSRNNFNPRSKELEKRLAKVATKYKQTSTAQRSSVHCFPEQVVATRDVDYRLNSRIHPFCNSEQSTNNYPVRQNYHPHEHHSPVSVSNRYSSHHHYTSSSSKEYFNGERFSPWHCNRFWVPSAATSICSNTFPFPHFSPSSSHRERFDSDQRVSPAFCHLNYASSGAVVLSPPAKSACFSTIE